MNTSTAPLDMPVAADAPMKSALSTQGRPPRPSALSTSLTYSWRALLKIKHVPEQLGDVIFIPILFTLMFTYMFGGAIAGSTSDYLQFLLPGSLAMSVVMVSVFAGVTLNTDISKGAFDRFRLMPAWRPALVVGGLIGDIGRYVIASTITIALGLVLGYRPEGGVVGVLAAVALIILFASSLSWIWTSLALVLRTPESVMNLGTTVLFLLTLGSNVFVDPRTMPGWLQAVVDVNPVSHLVIAVRGLMAGSASASEVGWVLLSSGLMVAVFAPLTMALYRRKQ